jgi:(1->4)-alpha-D-glucan 1-alpha-D-glucosylmutase
MLATSTHDTKRSEDVRARLNVLSEVPRLWSAFVMRARRLNRSKKITISDGRVVPDGNEEYLLYQTLVGMWPWKTESNDRAELVSRMQEYMIKAVHEAKVNLSWVNQNPEYVEALRNFIAAILTDGARANNFVALLEDFLQPIAFYGAINSLAQTTLKLTSPGNPDIYQGTELWDFSLVDPDNRRPVDFALRREMLSSLRAGSPDQVGLCNDLLQNYQDGRIKMWVTMRGLELRRENPEPFQKGSYVPLESSVTNENLCCFARVWAEHGEKKVVVVAVPRFSYTLTDGKSEKTGEDVWDDAVIQLPAEAPAELENIFTGERISANEGRLRCADLFRRFPVCVLKGL